MSTGSCNLLGFRNSALELAAAVLGVTPSDLECSRNSHSCLHNGCKQSTGAYPYFCDQHGPMAYEMTIGKSINSSEEEGTGLFTCTNLHEGDFIALYDANIIELEDAAAAAETGDHVLKLPADLYAGKLFAVDASKVGSCLGRYVNQAGDAGDDCCGNAQFDFQPTPRGYFIPVIKATRYIQSGDEILLLGAHEADRNVKARRN